jgi:hypothetical protein
MSFLDDAISTIGQGLAQTAISEADDATGLNVGGALQSLFGNNQTTGGQTLAATAQALAGGAFPMPDSELDLLKDSVGQQTQMIQNLGNQLSGIATAIAQISGEIAGIEQMLQKLQQEQLYTQWAQADDDLKQTVIPAIQSAYSTYGGYISSATATPSSDIQRFLDGVLAPGSNGFDAMMSAINAAILDVDQSKGVLQLWSNMVVPLVLNGAIDYREAVDEYCAYYSKLAYAQLQAVNLLMEANNYSATESAGDPDAAKLNWADYRGFIKGQEDTFIRWLIPLIMAGGSMPASSSEVITYANVHAIMQLDPGVQALGGVATGSYFRPSSMLEAAETLLANLYVTDPDALRIVAHVFWSDFDPVDNAMNPHVFRLVGSDGSTTYNPASRTTMGPYSWGGVMPDVNFGAPGLSVWMKRMVYSAGDGESDPLADPNFTYALEDPGLPPLATYTSSQPLPAISDPALAYSLSVGGAQQFDFMNVLAYVTPQASLVPPYGTQ